MSKLLAFIFFILITALYSSATQSEDERDFDPLSFLVDPYENEKSTSSHSLNEQPNSTVAQVHLYESQASTNHAPRPKRIRLKVKSESNEDYQKRRYKRHQTLFHLKSKEEKEKLSKQMLDHHHNYRIRTKQKIGFQSRKLARIAGLKVLQKAGLANEQHQQELKQVKLEKQISQQKYEARKRSQGFKRTAKGWVKVHPDDKLR